MKDFMIETSARHIHISREDMDVLFGKGTELTWKKDLSQPGQFACEERLTVVGPKREIKGVTILGPMRKQTQVEISLTDARSIGIAAPIRESGDLAGSPGCKLIGPCGEIEIPEGVIAAKRHIHMTPEEAAEFDVTDKEIVCVKVDTPERPLIFDEVVVRVHPTFALAMHIDTDESNAAGLGKERGIIIKK